MTGPEKLANIAACAEKLALPGDHHHTDIRFSHSVDSLDHICTNRQSNRIGMLGPVERETANAVAHAQEDLFLNARVYLLF